MHKYSLENTAKFISPLYQNPTKQLYPNSHQFLKQKSCNYSQPFESILSKSHTKSTNSKKSKKIINFTGDMSKNMQQILSNLSCCKNCIQEFREILQIFVQKLEKLRNQRDIIKEKYINDVYQKQNKILQLQKQNNFIKDKLVILLEDTQGQQQQESSQLAKFHHYIGHNSVNQIMGNDNIPQNIDDSSKSQHQLLLFQTDNNNSKQNQEFSSDLYLNQTHKKQIPRNYHTNNNNNSNSNNNKKGKYHRRHNSHIQQQDIQQQESAYQDNIQTQQENYQTDTKTQNSQSCENYQKIKRMAVKYNLTNPQLQKLIYQYLNKEGDQQLYGNDNKEIKKLKKLQNQLKKQREKKEIRNQLNQFIKSNLGAINSSSNNDWLANRI